MRTLAIGDIHGHFNALQTLIAFVGVRADDRIVTLGDYVDRGPASAAVLDWIIAQTLAGRVIPLRGNHEVLMSNARDDARDRANWLAAGGEAALASYGADADITAIPAAHWHFLNDDLLAYYETSSHFFVHANAYPEYELCDQPNRLLYWERITDPRPHCSGKVMICGHTPQRDGRPRSWGFAVCIDTAIGWGGWLTCLDVATGQYWQATESGETRTDWL